MRMNSQVLHNRGFLDSEVVHAAMRKLVRQVHVLEQ